MERPIDELVERYTRDGSVAFRGMVKRTLTLIDDHSDLFKLSAALPKAWANSETLAAALSQAMPLCELQGRAEIEQIVTPEFEEVWSLPFKEAIARFRQRLNVPLEEWETIAAQWREYAFWITGLTNAQLLAEVRSMLDRAMTTGSSYETFAQDFKQKTESAGWQPREGVSNRARIVFDANMRTAHATGRWIQATKPHVINRYPVWEWRHRDSVRPRPHHIAMNGMRFTAPLPLSLPCGFRCRCTWIPRKEDGSETTNYVLGDRLNPKTGQLEKVVHVPMDLDAQGKPYRYNPQGKLTPMADLGWMPPTDRTRPEVIRGMLADLPADLRSRVESANLGGAE